ncbi:MAG: exosortase/archaeosortase family protein [Candidatus Obscuribacterales bacterium]|nr:exosortase/archaeosortase family protein [Candidatus Obscuribacterales bacterium]
MTPRQLLLLQVLSFWPVWVWYFERLTDGSDEPLGIVALVTLAALAFSRKGQKNQNPLARKPSAIGPAVVLLLYGFAALFAPQAVQALIAIMSIALIASGAARCCSLKPGDWALVTLSLPVVATANFYFGYPLRYVVAWLSCVCLRMFGVPVSSIGTELTGAAGIVEVDAPCSGIKMLWFCAYLAATFASAMGFSWWRSAAIAGISVFAAIAGNVLRVACLYCLETGMLRGTQTSNLEPFLHQTVGVAAFLLSAGIIAAFALRSVRKCSSMDRFPGETASIRLSLDRHQTDGMANESNNAGRSPPIDDVIEPPSAREVSTQPALGSEGVPPEASLVAPKPEAPAPRSFRYSLSATATLSILMVCGAAAPFLHRSQATESSSGAYDWPAKLENRALTPLPLTAEQHRFLSGFPGKVRLFTDGTNTIIWRIVIKESRQVHPSSDCYKGMGYSVELKPAFLQSNGVRWSTFEANRGSEKLKVRETIIAPDSTSWIDVSSWYWDAILKRTSGPWKVITVVQRAQ